MHVARKGDMKNVCNILVGNPGGRNFSEDEHLDVMLILNGSYIYSKVNNKYVTTVPNSEVCASLELTDVISDAFKHPFQDATHHGGLARFIVGSQTLWNRSCRSTDRDDALMMEAARR